MVYVNHLGKDLVVRRANHIVDIFWGNSGWNPHARLHIKTTPKGKFLSPVSGDHVPAAIFKQVLAQVGA